MYIGCEGSERMSQLLVVIFHASAKGGRLEEIVGRAQHANVEDLIDKLTGIASDIVVATPAAEDATAFRHAGAELVDTTRGGSFRFGEALAGILRRKGANAVLVLGSGSGVLLEDSHIAALVEFAGRSAPTALFNNFYSCDFVALSGAQVLLEIPLPPSDNALGFALADAGIPCFAAPRDAASQFDIDVPMDLCLLKEADQGGAALRRVLDAWDVGHPTLGALCEVLTDRSALMQLGGRIQPGTWQAFEQATACRTGGWIEGRGLKGYPDKRERFVQGLVADDPIAFFDRLAKAADGAILDTRPLLAVGNELPPAHDRYASDLFLVDEVRDLRWRAFTEAARNASIPVVLGGHNLVSGGLFLLADRCWKGRDLPRRLHPESVSWREEHE